VIKNNKIDEKTYWEFPQIDDGKMLRNKKEIYDEFEFLLKDAIKIRMRSDVPFGAFLSGGLDSSSIVSQMSLFSEHPINTFTIGFNDKYFDESKLANDVARSFKTAHFTGTVTPTDFDNTLSYTAYHFDEPFGDSSAIPTIQVSKLAREKVKMVLTGDGGDEVLSGYTSYTGIKLASLIKKIPLIIRKFIISNIYFLSKVFKGNIRYKLNKIKNIIETAELDFVDRMVVKGAGTNIQLIKELTKNIPNVIEVEGYLKMIMKPCRFKDDFYKLMYFNYVLSLPNDYLVKVDRASMANSLETRLPFLDYRLVELMAKVHMDVKMEGWERKSVLRNTIGKILPKSILKAPKKGFGIPVREWFKEKDFNDFLVLNLQPLSNFLDYNIIRKIISDNTSGKNDNGNFLWTLLMLSKKI
jgi:asparagine synthase (glutamine-hydrolysing)